MRVIYIDDEKPALDNFRLTAGHFPEISQLNLFQDGSKALDYAKTNTVDVAFCDMEMPGIHGLELAKKLKEHDPHIRIIFVTAYSQYALDAWSVDATGYLLKPYTAADIRKELGKCTYQKLPSHRVVIQTIPTFGVTVDGEELLISGSKPRELFALLVDRGKTGITTGEGIACLWPGKSNDASAQSLMRMTYKRLADALQEAGIGDIIESRENRRFLRTAEVDCDLYRILDGDKQAMLKYGGQYLAEYEWAEERNAQLHWKMQNTK